MAARKPENHRKKDVPKRTLPRLALALFGLAFLVAAVVALVHWPALNAKAITFDDTEYLTKNQLVQQPGWVSAGRFLTEVFEPSTVGGYYQPLTMISLMLDYAIAGQADNLRPFHLTSLILHVINTLLLMFLLYMLFGQPWIAAGTALIFGIHPMTVESVAWVAERKTLLAAFFSLGCMIAYARYIRRCDWKTYVVCVGLYILALMSKPTSIPIPLALLLLDYWPLNRLNKWAVLEKIPLLVVGLIFTVITVISQSRTASVMTEGEHSFVQAPLIMCHNIVFYLCKFVWPANLSALYPIPQPMILSNPTIIAGVIGSGFLIAFLVVSLKWTRALLAGWLIFVVILLPASGVVGFTMTLTADRHFYLPAIGFMLMIAWMLIWLSGVATGVRRLAWRPVATGFGIVVVALLFGIGTRQYLKEWQNTERHKFYMLKLAPDSPYTNYSCGNYYKDIEQYERAIKYYSKAIELKPDYLQACLNRGAAYAKIGDFNHALADYGKVIELSPDYAKAYSNRGISYHKMHDYDQAIRDFSKAIELQPNNAEDYNRRGAAYRDSNKYDLAIRDYDRAIHLRPDYAKAYNNRGVAYKNTKNYTSALRDFTKAIELMPESMEVYTNRGIAYSDLHEYARAIDDLTEAVRLNPDYAIAYCQRGHVYANMGDHRRANENYTRAIELKPDYDEALCNRGIAFGKLGDYERSLDDLSRAIEIRPDYAEAFNNRGLTYGIQGDYLRAIQDCTKAIELQPQHTYAYINRGNAFVGIGDPARAITDYSKAIELKPNYARAYHSRASAYYFTGQFAEAWADIEKCKQLGGQVNPQFIEALTRAAPRPN